MSEGEPLPVGQVLADNRVPELDVLYGGLGRRVVGLGIRRLLTGRPAGRARLSRHTSVFWDWIGLIGGPLAFAALWVWAVPWLWLQVAGGLLGGGLALVALVVAAAVDATVPPPAQPFCQSEALDRFLPCYAESGLVEVVPDQLWVAQVPLVFHGIQMGARMAIVRVGHVDLLVYSPLALSAEDLDRVRALGRVRWIVAPNALHHLFVATWLAAFPEAEAWAAPGLPARRPDLAWAGTLVPGGEVPWDPAVVRLQILEGHPWHQEAVLLHVPTATLLVADAIANLGHTPETGPMTRFLVELFGMGGRPCSPTEHKWTVEDREALGRSAARVAAWRFDRIILAHGRLVDVDADRVWRDAFAWVGTGG